MEKKADGLLTRAILRQARVELARLGGKARAKKLSKQELSESARRAVLALWKKAKENEREAAPRRK